MCRFIIYSVLVVFKVTLRARGSKISKLRVRFWVMLQCVRHALETAPLLSQPRVEADWFFTIRSYVLCRDSTHECSPFLIPLIADQATTYFLVVAYVTLRRPRGRACVRNGACMTSRRASRTFPSKLMIAGDTFMCVCYVKTETSPVKSDNFKGVKWHERPILAGEFKLCVCSLVSTVFMCL